MAHRAVLMVTGRIAIALIAMAIGLRLDAAAAASEGAKRFPAGWSTRYAAEQFERAAGSTPGVDWDGPAGEWYTNAVHWKRAGTPRAPVRRAIAVWGGPGGGHVAVVLSFTASGVTVEEMNWGAPLEGCTDPAADCYGRTEQFRKVTTETLPYDTMMQRGAYAFIGYIYPQRLVDPGAPPAGVTSAAAPASTPEPSLPPATLPEPADLQARARANGTIEVTWDAAPGALAYTLQRRLTGEAWADVATSYALDGVVQMVVDRDVAAGTRYQYRVRALSPEARSSWSGTDSSTATPPETLPEPADLQARARVNGTIEVTWDAAPGALAYTLQRRIAGDDAWADLALAYALDGGVRMVVDRDVAAGTRYQYRVRALSPDAWSSWSGTDSSTARAPGS